MALCTITLIIYYLLRAYQIVLGISIILSWIPNARSTRFGSVVQYASDWYLGYFRYSNVLVLGGINFGTVIGFLLYDFAISLLWI